MEGHHNFLVAVFDCTSHHQSLPTSGPSLLTVGAILLGLVTRKGWSVRHQCSFQENMVMLSSNW